MSNNPIFIEYYIKYDCDCYKIMLPWDKFGTNRIVLCKVKEGYELAKTIAIGVVTRNLIDVIKDKPEKD